MGGPGRMVYYILTDQIIIFIGPQRTIVCIPQTYRVSHFANPGTTQAGSESVKNLLYVTFYKPKTPNFIACEFSKPENTLILSHCNKYYKPCT